MMANIPLVMINVLMEFVKAQLIFVLVSVVMPIKVNVLSLLVHAIQLLDNVFIIMFVMDNHVMMEIVTRQMIDVLMEYVLELHPVMVAMAMAMMVHVHEEEDIKHSPPFFF
jgi:hypothetical protein